MIKKEDKYKIINGTEHKKCRQCEEFKPMTKEYYQKNKNFKDGFMAICKDCVKKPELRKSKIKGFNEYKINDDITVLYLNNREGKIFECYIDTEDLPILQELNYRWCANYDKKINGYYAQASVYDKETKKTKCYYMHKIISGNGDGRENVVHHKDKHSTLDNRKSNLEIVPYIVNVQLREGANKNNKTGIRNVHLINKYGGEQVYMVQIMKNYKRHAWEFRLDQFEEACEFAKQKRIELFGKE